MGIAMPSFTGLLASLHGALGGVLGSLFGARAVGTAQANARQSNARTAPVRSAVRPRAGVPSQCRRATRPLRVFRVREDSARAAGRIVISGSIADVCAELDRLSRSEKAH